MNKKLKLFRITGLLDNLDLTLERLISLKCIYAIKASEFKQLTHGLSPVSTDNSWNIIYQEIKELELESKIDIPVIDKHTIDYSFKEIQEYVHNTHVKLHTLIEYQKITERLISQYNDALIQINNIIDLDISLDDIFSCHYINARFGKLPIDSLDILNSLNIVLSNSLQIALLLLLNFVIFVLLLPSSILLYSFQRLFDGIYYIFNFFSIH